MTDSNRPLSPHLQVYKWRVHMVTSIMHRATGAALVVGMLLFVWWLGSISYGAESYATFVGFIKSWFGRLVLFGITFSLLQHMASGIRHLYMDKGDLLDLPSNRKSAMITYVFSGVTTLVIWAYAYGMMEVLA